MALLTKEICNDVALSKRELAASAAAFVTILGEKKAALRGQKMPSMGSEKNLQ